MTIALSHRPRHCPEGTTHGVLLCLVLFLFIPLTGSPLVAQTDRSPSNLGWLTVGMGGGIGRGEPTFMVGAEASFQHDVHLFSARVLFLGEPFEPWGGGRGRCCFVRKNTPWPPSSNGLFGRSRRPQVPKAIDMPRRPSRAKHRPDLRDEGWPRIVWPGLLGSAAAFRNRPLRIRQHLR